MALTRALAVLLCSAYAACGVAPRDAVAARDSLTASRTTATPGVSVAVPPTPAAPFTANGCVHGGSTPAEVRAAMGEPDSIVGGWWVYGRTQIQFGYGTVQDFVDGGNLVRCGPPSR